MVSIRSDDIRGRWGRLIDNTASFTSLDLSGQSSGITAAISGQVLAGNISGQVSGFAISPTTINAGSATFSQVIVQSGLTAQQISGANINVSGIIFGAGSGVTLNIQSGIVAGTFTVSGITIIGGPITIGANASGISFSGLQNLPTRGPANYLIDSWVTHIAAINTKTGLIEASGSAADVIQTVFNNMALSGGTIHFAAGIYNSTSGLTIPSHPGLSYVIEGDGWRNTKIQYTGTTASGTYLIDAFADVATSGWKIVSFKDIQLWGGTATNDRRSRVLRLGRNSGNAVAVYHFDNIRVANGLGPMIEATYVQDSYWYDVHAESYGSTPTGIVDLLISGSSHINLEGCDIGSVFVDQSRLNAFGGTMQHLEYYSVNNYQSIIDGVFFDPNPSGFTHQIAVGTSGNVVGVTFQNVGFSTEPNNLSGERFFYIHTSRNVTINNPKFVTNSSAQYFIEVTSAAKSTLIRYPSEEGLDRIANSAATNTTIWSPSINNNLIIHNISGTAGATVLDDWTSNRLALASAGLHLDLELKSVSGGAKIRMLSRNAANNADVNRMQIGNIADAGTSYIDIFENLTIASGMAVGLSGVAPLHFTSGRVNLSGINYIGSVQASSAPTAASGGAIPAHAKGWITIQVSGTNVQMPFF